MSFVQARVKSCCISSFLLLSLSIVHYNGHMNKTVTASEARNNFFAILKEIEVPGVSVTITYEGHPKGVLMSIEDFEGWMETLDLMSDPEEAAIVLDRMRNWEKEETVTLEEFKKNLGLAA
ncbi:MAG: prevent-host-death family protein [Candidatus Peregrinibacteria bacterium Greene0416_62]|nr:MAG: prevent-host-death family protein [Candidatus Peregrinibacteria bacterium Greene0416_62]TSC99710.1 MAG: prevent-host-death family protein [Candidatus Peregrinibacteria bacterium Greene1014_49]